MFTKGNPLRIPLNDDTQPINKWCDSRVFTQIQLNGSPFEDALQPLKASLGSDLKSWISIFDTYSIMIIRRWHLHTNHVAVTRAMHIIFIISYGICHIFKAASIQDRVSKCEDSSRRDRSLRPGDCFVTQGRR